MRPGQQNNNNNNNNKRMRGRNRKGPNPLTRSFESNGPDVKIRGTAQHIAEKYVSLARDAQSSGDRVMAENYLQHAEHYFRVIAAAQVQNPQQQPFYRPDMEDDGLDEEDDRFSDRFGQHDRLAQERLAGEGEFAPAVGEAPQPYVNGNGNGNGHYGAGERPQRERGERQEPRGDRQEPRGERPERQEARAEGGERPEGRGERPFRQNREDRGPRGERGERRERGERPVRNDLPRFVTGDTPQPVIDVAPEPAPVVAAPAPAPAPAPIEEIVVAPVAIEAAPAAAPSEEPAVGATSEEEMFRPRRRRASRARTRRTAEEGAEPTLAIETVDEE